MSAHETAEAILLVIKRIAKWLFFGALIVTGFIASLYGGKILQEEYENRPRLVTSIGNVALGDKLTDVLFRAPEFKIIKDGDVSEYKGEQSNRWLGIKESLVIGVGYECKEAHDYTEFGGISCDQSGELIFRRFEGAVKVQCIRDNSDPEHIRHRVYDVAKYGIRYHLISNRVVAFQVHAPSVLEASTGRKWGGCE